MVSFTKRFAMSCGALLAVLFLAGSGLAQANAVGQAGGQAIADAQGSYHADATGATQAADDEEDKLRDEAVAQARENSRAYEEAEADASSEVDASPMDERPQCNCRDNLAQVEEQGHGQFETAEHLEHEAGVENEYVDAGADLEATGQAEGWYDELFSGVTDAFDKVSSLLETDTDVNERAEAHVEQSLDTDDELRDEAFSTLEEDRELTEGVEPKTQGQLEGQHSAEAATSAVTGASGP